METHNVFLENLKLDLLQSIKPIDVERYVSNLPNFEFGYQDDNVIIYYKKDSEYDQISIPKNQDYRDYAKSLSYTIKEIAYYQKRSLKEIITILGLKHPVDILKYTMKGDDTEDGTLPLEEGAKLYSGAVKTILALASYTDKPNMRYYGKIKYPNTLNLLNLCRIGQTEIGSYSVPLFCPLYTKNNKKEIQILGWADNPATTFTRMVTINTMKALDHITDYISKDKTDQLINPKEDDMVISYNLCEAITQMEPSENLELKITSEWLLSPPSERIPKTATFKKDYFKDVEEVALALKPERESEVGDYFGHIYLLKDNLNKGYRGSDKVRDGAVGIIVGDGSELINARMNLSEDNYDKASKAHSLNKLVKVRGVLKRSTRSNRLEEIEEFSIIDIEQMLKSE